MCIGSVELWAQTVCVLKKVFNVCVGSEGNPCVFNEGRVCISRGECNCMCAPYGCKASGGQNDIRSQPSRDADVA